MADSSLSLLTYPNLQNTLRTEFARARRYGYPLSCLALRIDQLDVLGQHYGPEAQREVVRAIVGMVQDQSRLCDSVAQYGDRLTLVLPHTDAGGASVIGQRLVRKAAELGILAKDARLAVTISVGAATIAGEATIFFDSVLKSAEQALAEAELEGGRLVSSAVARPIGEAPPD